MKQCIVMYAVGIYSYL